MNFLTKEQFTEMWKLQDSLNTATSGPDWKEKNQNWNLAIKDEIMEFFNYIGWKWWKEPEKTKKPTDMQARLELVDIWHFLLSSIIEEAGDIMEDFAGNWLRFDFHIRNTKYQTLPDCKGLDYLDAVHNVDSIAKVQHLTDVIHFCEWSWEELYKAYIGKVALNNFRQANGYKEGSYKKVWKTITSHGAVSYEEDNYFLESIMQLLTESNLLTYQNVYDNLTMTYDRILNK